MFLKYKKEGIFSDGNDIRLAKTLSIFRTK